MLMKSNGMSHIIFILLPYIFCFMVPHQTKLWQCWGLKFLPRHRAAAIGHKIKHVLVFRKLFFLIEKTLPKILLSCSKFVGVTCHDPHHWPFDDILCKNSRIINYLLDNFTAPVCAQRILNKNSNIKLTTKKGIRQFF